MMRRTVMRYVNLSYVLTLSMISPQVKRRFPTFTHLEDAGEQTRITMIPTSVSVVTVESMIAKLNQDLVLL